MLAKGGRLDGGDTVTDSGGAGQRHDARRLDKGRVATTNVAGSGDILSAAITAHLAAA